MIPKEFQILNHTITVVIDNEYCHKNDCFGQYLYQENKIVLADKYKSKKNWVSYKKETIEHVFYHELIHCILYYMNNDLWLDEKFVDQFSGLLAQTMKKDESIEINRRIKSRNSKRTV
jgi:hypothetical protein